MKRSTLRSITLQGVALTFLVVLHAGGQTTSPAQGLPHLIAGQGGSVSAPPQFRLTTGYYTGLEDLDLAVIRELGPNWRPADWEDIKLNIIDVDPWAQGLSIPPDSSVLLELDGFPRWRGLVPFMATYTHAYVQPGALVLDSLDENNLILTAGSPVMLHILCVHDEVPLSPKLDVLVDGGRPHRVVETMKAGEGARHTILIRNIWHGDLTWTATTKNMPGFITLTKGDGFTTPDVPDTLTLSFNPAASQGPGGAVFDVTITSNDLSNPVMKLTFGVFIVEEPFTAHRRVLMEDYTSTNCHNCPNAMPIIDSLERMHPDDVLVMSYHLFAGFPPDDMQTTTGTTVCNDYLGTTSMPGASFDRSHHSFYDATGSRRLPIFFWERSFFAAFAEAAATPAGASITLRNCTYDPIKKVVQGTAALKLTKGLGQPLRLNLVIVEDSINRAQAHDGGIFKFPFFHRNAVRQVWPNATGIQIKDSAIAAPETEYIQPFSFSTKDSAYTNARLIVFAHTGDSTWPGAVIQSEMIRLRDIVISGVGDAPTSALPASPALLGCTPNPVSAAATIRFSLPVETQADLVLYNLLGERILPLASGRLVRGEHAITFNTSLLPGGVYLARLAADGVVHTMRVLIVH